MPARDSAERQACYKNKQIFTGDTNQWFPVYAKCKTTSETRAGNLCPVSASVPAQLNGFGHTYTLGH